MVRQGGEENIGRKLTMAWLLFMDESGHDHKDSPYEVRGGYALADTHGIVYTPQPLVNFMVASVEHVLKEEFGKTLADRGVHILDLGGNVRKNPKLSGTTHNVFGIQVGVSINLFVRKPKNQAAA